MVINYIHTQRCTTIINHCAQIQVFLHLFRITASNTSERVPEIVEKKSVYALHRRGRKKSAAHSARSYIYINQNSSYLAEDFSQLHNADGEKKKHRWSPQARADMESARREKARKKRIRKMHQKNLRHKSCLRARSRIIPSAQLYGL